MPENLTLIIPPAEITSIVKRLAGELRAEYRGKNPVLVGVLKGAFVFLTDLVRELNMPFEVDFVQTSSYGKTGDAPSEKVLITREITSVIRGRDAVIVEGIVDRGLTAGTVRRHIEGKGASSTRLCTLLKREGRPEVRADYVGKVIGAGFVVGYGMDFGERYRELSGIYVIG